MPGLSFREELIVPIRLGTKTQTIRKVREKRPIILGDELFLFANRVYKHCVPILNNGNRAFCTQLDAIRIDKDGHITINGAELSNTERFELAENEGFEFPVGLCASFQSLYGLPFEGVIIHWAVQRAPLTTAMTWELFTHKIEGNTFEFLATRYGIDEATIRNAIQDPRLNETKGWILEDYFDGIPIDEIAEKYGVWRSTVHAVVAESVTLIPCLNESAGQ